MFPETTFFVSDLPECLGVMHKKKMYTSFALEKKSRKSTHGVTAYRYTKILDELQEDTERHGGPPDCIVRKSDEFFCHFLYLYNYSWNNVLVLQLTTEC